MKLFCFVFFFVPVVFVHVLLTWLCGFDSAFNKLSSVYRFFATSSRSIHDGINNFCAVHFIAKGFLVASSGHAFITDDSSENPFSSYLPPYTRVLVSPPWLQFLHLKFDI